MDPDHMPLLKNTKPAKALIFFRFEPVQALNMFVPESDHKP